MHFSIAVSTPWPDVVPLNFVLHSSITINSHLAHLAHHIGHASPPGGALLFPPNSSYWRSNSILLHRKVTSIPSIQISQIKLNDIRIEFHPIGKLESFWNTSCAPRFFVPLMNWVFLCLLARMTWEILLMTLRLCVIAMIPNSNSGQWFNFTYVNFSISSHFPRLSVM
jgi:hypothetical protein